MRIILFLNLQFASGVNCKLTETIPSPSSSTNELFFVLYCICIVFCLLMRLHVVIGANNTDGRACVRYKKLIDSERMRRHRSESLSFCFVAMFAYETVELASIERSFGQYFVSKKSHSNSLQCIFIHISSIRECFHSAM